MALRLVTHRAVRPADGKVILQITLTSQSRWLPYGGGLGDWVDEVTFQTREEAEGARWEPSFVVVHLGRIVITTMDAYLPASAAIEEGP